MAANFDNIVSSLNHVAWKIGNDNTNSSNYNEVDWTIKSNFTVGWLTISTDVLHNIALRNTPFDQVQSLSDDRFLTVEKKPEAIIVETGKISVSYKMVQKGYEVTYNGSKYKTSPIVFPEVRDCNIVGDSKVNPKTIRVTFEGRDNAYLTNSYYFEKYDYVPNDSTTGLPFYCWYSTNDGKIYVGVRLYLSNGSEKKNMTGWILVYEEGLPNNYFEIRVKETSEATSATITNESNNNNNNTDMNWSGNPEWENSEGGYDEALLASDSAAQMDYWKQLYGANMGGYSLKSHRSIIGLPLQFMSNVDMRVGSSTYGKQFMEDILYDMNIACIKPGGPVLNPKFNDEEYSADAVSSALATAGKLKAYWESLSEKGVGETLKQYLFTLFKGGSARFYSFQSDYTHYIHYVNTLCHLFITYLNIGDKYYNIPGGKKKYAFYNDDPREVETDEGLGLHHQFGWDNAVYVYYSPESQLSHTFSNTTQPSSLNNTLMEASNAVKEWGFFINAAGIETGKGVSSFGQSLAANVNNGGLLGRLFGDATEGVTTVLAGNNLSLPEIYSDSETTVQHTFKIKLASPYGDPESVFLYVLRPLARLLAFSLPRQYGPNSYMSPFIIQAFSKGQFNCQLGIVTSLSITRCGNGGESHTINHIPTELEVTLEIQDMYEKVFLSNEYFGNSTWKGLLGGFVDKITGTDVGTYLTQTGTTLTASRLLFNNVGLIDFVASFCGANLNQPTYMSGWTVIYNMMKNRTAEIITYTENDGWKFPQWEKQLNDAYHDAVTKLTSSITTVG